MTFVMASPESLRLKRKQGLNADATRFHIPLRKQNLLGSTIGSTDVACNVSPALIFGAYTVLIL